MNASQVSHIPFNFALPFAWKYVILVVVNENRGNIAAKKFFLRFFITKCTREVINERETYQNLA